MLVYCLCTEQIQQETINVHIKAFIFISEPYTTVTWVQWHIRGAVWAMSVHRKLGTPWPGHSDFRRSQTKWLPSVAGKCLRSHEIELWRFDICHPHFSWLANFKCVFLQSSYACLCFQEVLWPEFSIWNFFSAILRYQRNYDAIQVCTCCLCSCSGFFTVMYVRVNISCFLLF